MRQSLIRFGFCKNIGEEVLNNSIAQAERKYTVEMFLEHFEKDLDIYVRPLKIAIGNLNYTARFARTLFILSISDKERQVYFQEVKKSMASAKKLSPSSALIFCDLFNRISLDGTENQIIQKMREYAEANSYKFSSVQRDAFSKAYKLLMINKAFADIQFTGLKMQKHNREETFCKMISLQKKMSTHIDTEKSKLSVNFEFKTKGKSCRIKLIGINKICDILIEDVVKECKNYQGILVAYFNSNFDKIDFSSEHFQTKLGKLIIPKPEIKEESENKKFHELVYHIAREINRSTKYEMMLSEVDLLRVLLRHRTLKEIEEMYTYTKLYSFHTELYKCYQKKPLAALDFNYLSLFDREELTDLGMNAMTLAIRDEILLTLQEHHGMTSLVVYLAEEEIVDLYASLARLTPWHEIETPEVLTPQEKLSKNLLLTALTGNYALDKEHGIKVGLVKTILKPSDLKISNIKDILN